MAHAEPAVERWLRRTGLVPLPAFLLLHLGRELWLGFADDVTDVLRAEPGMLARLSSWLLVWLPLALHVALAAWLTLARRVGPARPADVPRATRVLLRVSGVLALLFVAYHAKRYAGDVWVGEADARDGGFRLLDELSSTRFGVPLAAGAYLLGVATTAAHAGLGVHRGLLAEGLLASPPRRLTSARACAAFGVLCFCAGAAAVIRVASGLLVR